MAMDIPTFSLTLPSDPRMLSVARTFFEAVCQTLQIDRNTMHAVILATGEALTNIIRHAHRGRPQAQIQIQFQVASDKVVLSIQDEGEPFDLTAVPQLNPGELRLGGRGVYIMRALMDEISCQVQEGRGNLLRMVKHWPSQKHLRCG